MPAYWADVSPPARAHLRWIAPLLVLGLACASGGPGAGRRGAGGAAKSPFPDPRTVEELASRSGEPQSFLEVDWAQVDRWQLSGPFPTKIGDEPLRDPGPWDQPLLDVGARRPGLLLVSEAMHCVARELGLFFAREGRLAGLALQRFVKARCGATGSELVLGTLTGSLPPEADEASILESWRPQVDELIGRYLGTGPRAAGLWFGREGDLGVAFVASARRSVLLEPADAVPDTEGWLRLRGEVLEPSEQVFAQINQGDYGFAECENEPGVEPPRFSLACPVDPFDETAWVQVASRAPGRILSDGVMLALARPSGAHADTYVRRSFGAKVRIESDDDLTGHLFDQVNRIRRRAGLRPLALAAEESEVTAALAPLYLGATFGTGDAAAADMAALGMVAGWRVPGVVRSGNVGGALVVRTRQLDLWLDEALQHPSFRALTLSPETSTLAIGPVVSQDPDYLGAAVASYALFDPDQSAAELARLHRRFDARYREAGLSPARRSGSLSEAAGRQLARVRAGRATPREAFDDLLTEVSAQVGMGVQGWILEGDSAEALPLPDELFDARVERFGSALGFYRPDEWPWGRTLAFVLTTLREPQRSAGLRPVGRCGAELCD